MKNTMCEMAGNGLLHARGLTYTKKGGKGGRKKGGRRKKATVVLDLRKEAARTTKLN